MVNGLRQVTPPVSVASAVRPLQVPLRADKRTEGVPEGLPFTGIQDKESAEGARLPQGAVGVVWQLLLASDRHGKQRRGDYRK